MERRISFAVSGTVLGAGLLLAACSPDLPTVRRFDPIQEAHPAMTWISSQPCQFSAPPNGTVNYPGSPNWATDVPTTGSACNVGWSLNFPWTPIYGNGPLYGVEWTRDAADPVGNAATRFMIPASYYTNGVASGLQNGPLEIAFGATVRNVSLVLSKDSANAGGLLAGHYMIALDSAGLQIGRADFDAGVDVSEKTILVGGIRKVIVYPVKVGHRDDYNVDIVEKVHHRISYAPDIVEPGALTCTPSNPTRFQTVTCTVTGTGVVVTKWDFYGAAYDDANTVWHVDGPTSPNSWKGAAITSGDVIAKATVNGVTRSKPLTASFSVQRRTGNSWSWGPLNHWKWTKGNIGAPPNCFVGVLLLYYDNFKTLGWSARTSTCDFDVLTPDPVTDSIGGYSVKQVTTGGPNNGLWYVSAITYQMLTWASINSVMTSGSSAKWNLYDQSEINLCSTAARKSITQANFYFFNKTCKGVDVDGLISGVWSHEGYGSADGNGHEAQLERGAQLPENELYVNEEGVYGLDQSSIRKSVVGLSRRIVLDLQPIWGDHCVIRDNYTPRDVWYWIPNPPHFLNLLTADNQCFHL